MNRVVVVVDTELHDIADDVLCLRRLLCLHHAILHHSETRSAFLACIFEYETDLDVRIKLHFRLIFQLASGVENI